MRNRLPSLLLETPVGIGEEWAERVGLVALGGSAMIRILILTFRGRSILRIGSLQSCIGTPAVKFLGCAIMKGDGLY